MFNSRTEVQRLGCEGVHLLQLRHLHQQYHGVSHFSTTRSGAGTGNTPEAADFERAPEKVGVESEERLASHLEATKAEQYQECVGGIVKDAEPDEDECRRVEVAGAG